MTDATIEAGRAAWKRLKKSTLQTYDDWKAVGRMLKAGRTLCMALAKTNTPQGTTYNTQTGKWLEDNGLDDISAQERYKAIKCVEHEDEIEALLATLSPEMRRRLNHPNAVWNFFRKSREIPKEPIHRHVVASAMPSHPRGRPIHWSQDDIRTGAAAMRESGSRDWFVLAKQCLEAVIPTEHTLLAKLEPPAKNRAPAQNIGQDHGQHVHA
jgi:hypothetical protein